MNILIIEDHEIVRRGLHALISELHPDARFVDAAAAPDGRRQLAQEKWHLVVIDVSLPGGSGLDLVTEAKRLAPKTPVLVLSTYAEEDYAVAAFKAGADGYLTKASVADELVQALRRVTSGGKYVSAALAERLAGALGARAPQAPHELLSPRELEVLRLVASGKTIRQIAAEFSLSEKTIATYRARLAKKLGVSSNVEIARYAMQHGLVD